MLDFFFASVLLLVVCVVCVAAAAAVCGVVLIKSREIKFKREESTEREAEEAHHSYCPRILLACL
jgi:hypothetical protein